MSFVLIFKQNRQLLPFQSKFAQKGTFRSEFNKPSKFSSQDSESSPPRYYEYKLSNKTDNFQFFGVNLGKLPDYMQYFGSYNIVGVTEHLVEAEMTCVEVDGCGCIV